MLVDGTGRQPLPSYGDRVVAPSGEQYEISGSGYRAVVTECGAGLRLLEHEGRPLVDGFAETRWPPAAGGSCWCRGRTGSGTGSTPSATGSCSCR